MIKKIKIVNESQVVVDRADLLALFRLTANLDLLINGAQYSFSRIAEKTGLELENSPGR